MPDLETVSAVECDSVLFIVTQRKIRLLLGVLITETKSYMRGQLIGDGGRTSITLDMLAEKSAGIVAFLVEEFGGKQDAVNDGPRRGVANIIKSDKVGVNAQPGFMTGCDERPFGFSQAP